MDKSLSKSSSKKKSKNHSKIKKQKNLEMSGDKSSAEVVNFIKTKKFELNSNFNQKGCLEFLKSKDEALGKIEICDEIDPSLLHKKEKEIQFIPISPSSFNLKGILKISPLSSNKEKNKRVSFNIGKPKPNVQIAPDCQSSKTANVLKNHNKAKNVFMNTYSRKRKITFEESARNYFEEIEKYDDDY